MSLADELKAEHEASTVFTTATWMAQWRGTLNEEDREAVDVWIADSSKPTVALYKVVKKHGYPRAIKTFREWLYKQRGNVDS
jgi:hypothetical protein